LSLVQLTLSLVQLTLSLVRGNIASNKQEEMTSVRISEVHCNDSLDFWHSDSPKGLIFITAGHRPAEKYPYVLCLKGRTET
jgi:hypothetical protein